MIQEGKKRQLIAKAKIGLVFFVVFSLLLAFMTPRISAFLFPQNRELLSSIIWISDFILFMIILIFFARSYIKASEEQKKSDVLLIEAYKSLGKANRKIELMTRAVNAASLLNGKGSSRDVVNHLFQDLVHSVLQTDFAILRFIQPRGYRTSTEWIHRNKSLPYRKISNKEMVKHRSYEWHQNNVHFVRSSCSDEFSTCVIAYAGSSGEETDPLFIQTLLNQIHLLAILSGLVVHKNLMPQKAANLLVSSLEK